MILENKKIIEKSCHTLYFFTFSTIFSYQIKHRFPDENQLGHQEGLNRSAERISKVLNTLVKSSMGGEEESSSFEPQASNRPPYKASCDFLVQGLPDQHYYLS